MTVCSKNIYLSTHSKEFDRSLSKGLRTLLGVCANLQVTAPLGIRQLTGQNSHDSIRRADNPFQALQQAIQ